MTPNQKAFLDMIASSEGTIGLGNNGYNVLVGGTFFDSYADHPRIIVHLKNGLNSSAAGRYQLLARYFDPYKELLSLPDFSPASQDAIALQQIRECGAIDNIEAGLIGIAIAKCSHIWASLPGANYGQHENTVQYLTSIYKNAGGSVAI